MAIALAGTTTNPTHSTKSFSHNSGQGDNRLLIVKVTSINTVTAVTYAGVSLTNTDGAAAAMSVTGTSGAISSIWKLVAPATGSNTVVVTGPVSNVHIVAETWTGVHQTTPLGTFGSATGTSTAPSVTITSATDEVVTDIVGASAALVSNTALTVGSGQTSEGTLVALSFGGTAVRSGASYETGAASTVMSWTTVGTCSWQIGAVPIKPAASGGGSTPVTPPTPPAGATLGVGIAEVSVVPRRTAPDFSPSTSANISTPENQQADWEASGMFPKVLQGTVQEGQIIWDDVWTLPSVAPAGAISISALPTQNSPTASLLVATQDVLVQYPLPVSGSPTTTAYPQLPLASTTTAEANAPENLLPLFYPSAFDGGGKLLDLVAVQCVGQNFTDGVDSWAISVRPDDTEPWSPIQRQYQAEALFWMESRTFGRVWRIAAQILDGDQDDPIGPSGSQIIGWFREVDADPGVYSQRARSSPEVS